MNRNVNQVLSGLPMLAQCQHACHAGKPEEKWWLLSIRGGLAHIVCGTCRCAFDGIEDAGSDLDMEPIPVTLFVEETGILRAKLRIG